MLPKVKLVKFFARNILIFSMVTFSLLQLSGQQTENIVLVTIDGLRWQEVFGGIDEDIRIDKNFTKDSVRLQTRYSAGSKEEARDGSAIKWIALIFSGFLIQDIMKY